MCVPLGARERSVAGAVEAREQSLDEARGPCVGARGSPLECVPGVPPVMPVPVLEVPAGPDARSMLSPCADACAASGTAKAEATARAINVLSFITIS
jgi:hypothetical protein